MTLDLRGLFCPEPVFRIKLALKTIPVNDEMQVMTDDPISEVEVQEWAKQNGHQVLRIAHQEKDILFLIRRCH